MPSDKIILPSGAELKNFKVRLHGLILYEDNAAHMTALENIRKGYQYLAMRHDSDTKEDGTLKKPHFHVMLKFRAAKYASALANELGIEPNMILGTQANEAPVQSFESMARYFMHLDDPQKAQYDFDLMEGPLREDAEAPCNGKQTESDRVLRIIELLDAQPKQLTMREFVILVCKNGLYSDCRRAGFMMTKVLEDHNRAIWDDFCRSKMHPDDPRLEEDDPKPYVYA